MKTETENNAYDTFFDIDKIAMSLPDFYRIYGKQLSMPTSITLRHDERDNLLKFHVINICLRIKNWKSKKGRKKHILTLGAYEARLLNTIFPKPRRKLFFIFISKLHNIFNPKFKNKIIS